MTHTPPPPAPGAGQEARFVVLADDLTSAAEAAGHAAATGQPADVVLDPGAATAPAGPAVWPCVDLDSRTLPPEEAAARHAQVTGQLSVRRGKPTVRVGLYKTMDSSLRGNWPAELAAVMRASGRRVAVVAPACPAYDRRTVGGTQLADGLPVHQGPAGTDPVRPVTESSLLTTLTTAGFRTTLLDPARDEVAATVTSALARTASPRDGADPLRACVVDASTEEDLARIAASVRPYTGDLVLCGSPGLWEALLPATAGNPGSGEPLGTGDATASSTGSGTARRTNPTTADSTGPGAGRALVLVGSLHPTTRHQLARLAQTGVPVLSTDDPTGCSALVDLFDTVPVLALATPGAVAGDPADARRHLRDLAELGAHCARSLPGLGLVLSGGDTARELATVLGAPAIRAVGTLEPGIPLGVLTGPHRHPVVTKAGGFGGPDSLVAAVAALTQEARVHTPSSTPATAVTLDSSSPAT